MKNYIKNTKLKNLKVADSVYLALYLLAICLFYPVLLGVYYKSDDNISMGDNIASDMSDLTQDYLDAGGDMESLDLTSFPAAYAALSEGLEVNGITYQYAPLGEEALNPSVFDVHPDGKFAYIGDGTSPYFPKEYSKLMEYGEPWETVLVPFYRGFTLFSLLGGLLCFIVAFLSAFTKKEGLVAQGLIASMFVLIGPYYSLKLALFLMNFSVAFS